jgi:hypothetical protein
MVYVFKKQGEKETKNYYKTGNSFLGLMSVLDL